MSRIVWRFEVRDDHRFSIYWLDQTFVGTAAMTRVAGHIGAGPTMIGIGIVVTVIGALAWAGPIRRSQEDVPPTAPATA